ncbi:efflux RND transporter periplasmic adaptor subunit [Microvirga sp. TS319]
MATALLFIGWLVPVVLTLWPAPGTAQATMPAPTVTVATATQTCFEDRVFFIGTLVPREEVLVIPLVEGARVNEVPVEAGERVRSGQVLARLSRPEPPGGGSIDVTAPAGGIVLARSARVGLIVSASSVEPLFRIARDGAMDVMTGLPASRLVNVQTGRAVLLQTPGGEIRGQVHLVAPEVDRQSRLALVRINFDGDPRLPFGASVSGVIETGQSCGPGIPLSALVSERDQTLVRRVRDGKVESVAVKTGLIQGDMVEVESGLAAGDRVVARASDFLREGDVVRTAPAEVQQ